MKELMLTIAVMVLAMVPFITYIDYYLLKPHAICKRCGLEPEKHTWLLATTLEMFLFICGLLFGLLLR